MHSTALIDAGAADSPAAPAVPPHPPALANGHGAPDVGPEGAAQIAVYLQNGEVPSVREIRRVMYLGQPRAQEVHSYLAALART
jgi:hypothetical protein